MNNENWPRRVGILIIALSSLFLIYFTVWTLVLTFYEDAVLSYLFPNKKWAIIIPVWVGSAALLAAMCYGGRMLQKIE